MRANEILAQIEGCLPAIAQRWNQYSLTIRNGNDEWQVKALCSPKQEPDLYGQYTLSFSPTHEEVEQFIATQEASNRIVTMLDISLPSPRFIRATASQAWERNVGGGNWSLGDWFGADKFNYIWQESMRPSAQMRIDQRYTLWAMQDRLNPETGDISLNAYHYCCTAPNGDTRLYESDVRIFELAVGANPADKHLVRMMVSDRIEDNPRAWEVLISREV